MLLDSKFQDSRLVLFPPMASIFDLYHTPFRTSSWTWWSSRWGWNVSTEKFEVIPQRDEFGSHSLLMLYRITLAVTKQLVGLQSLFYYYLEFTGYFPIRNRNLDNQHQYLGWWKSSQKHAKSSGIIFYIHHLVQVIRLAQAFRVDSFLHKVAIQNDQWYWCVRYSIFRWTSHVWELDVYVTEQQILWRGGLDHTRFQHFPLRLSTGSIHA